MNEEKKTFEPFHVDKAGFVNSFTMNPTSKKHVRAVALVCASNLSLSADARAKYAMDAGIQPVATAGEEKAIDYPVSDIYNSYTAAAALAQVLFKGCPKIIEITNNGIEVVDEELFDNLDEGVVNRAFLAFQMQRRGTPSAQHLF